MGQIYGTLWKFPGSFFETHVVNLLCSTVVCAKSVEFYEKKMGSSGTQKIYKMVIEFRMYSYFKLKYFEGMYS